MPDSITAVLDGLVAVRDLIDDAITDASQRPAAAPGEPDERLRVVLVGLERVKNAADGVQALAMTGMRREALAADDAERGGDDRPIRSLEEFVPDEIAALLACTRMAASLRYGTACEAQRLPTLGHRWRAGEIDARKVSVIADHLQHLPAHAAETLAEQAAAHATDHTGPQTREWLRRRVLAIDPDAAEQRRRAALLERKVVITPSADGMAELWARLPSVEARRMQVALAELAQALGSDDARTMDQRRADTLVDLVLGRATPTKVSLQVVVPVGTTPEGWDEPAWVSGLGPVTAEAARELLEQAGADVEERGPDGLLLVDAASGNLVSRVEPRYRPSPGLDRTVRSRDVTCRFPGCRRSALGRASGTDLDHTVAWPAGPTSTSNLAVLCRHHHRLKHSPGWAVTLLPDGTMTWTTPTGRQLSTDPWQYLDPDDHGGSSRDPDPPF